MGAFNEQDKIVGFPLSYILVFVSALVYSIIMLQADSETIVVGLFGFGVLAVVLANKLGFLSKVRSDSAANERLTDALSIGLVVVLGLFFYNSPFVLFLLATVLVYVIACLGLHLQFGYIGMLNFAGAAMLGVGGYTAALLGSYSFIPTIALLPIGGIAAAAVGSVLLPPMLRTKGHYSAVITIAFTLLFMTFLEVYPGFGGTQGLPIKSMSLFGVSFNENWKIGSFQVAFYFNYLMLALATAIVVVIIVRRIERSWIGLSLDSIRIDEIASQCFGINVNWWKAFAFTVGNFIVGLAGALYAFMLGYIAPTNFTFGDSLSLVTIIILGGLGSIWGVVLTSAIVIILPEKLQVIQEYRFLIYAILVIAVLLFRPGGLLPRIPRIYYPGWRP